MEKSLTFDKSINVVRSNSATSFWFEAVKNFDSKDYKSAFFNILRYVNSTVVIPNESSEAVELNLPHGSVIINIKIDSKGFTIQAPFLKVPAGGSGLGMMREISELNFTYLVLGQIILKENEFYIEYKDTLDNCEPYKLYYLLEEICVCADYYDDVFIDKFKTDSVKKSDLEYFTSAELELAHQKYAEIIKEGLSFVEYFESKRYYSLAWEMMETLFLKLDYVLAPQGILNTKLKEAKVLLYGQAAEQTVIANSKLKLNELINFDKEKMKSSFFHPKFLIPSKKRGEISYIQDFMDSTRESMQSSMGSKSYSNVSIAGLYLFYDLLYKVSIHSEISTFIDSALEKAGGKDWQTAAEIFMDAVNKIMDLNPEEDCTGKLSSGFSVASAKSIFGSIKGLFKKQLGEIL